MILRSKGKRQRLITLINRILSWIGVKINAKSMKFDRFFSLIIPFIYYVVMAGYCEYLSAKKDHRSGSQPSSSERLLIWMDFNFSIILRQQNKYSCRNYPGNNTLGLILGFPSESMPNLYLLTVFSGLDQCCCFTTVFGDL